MNDDPFDLQRFVKAQAAVIDTVRQELRDGQKRSHWMWFVFPQFRGLGHSEASRFYGIGSLAEARAYLAHPILGPRLEECSEMVNLAPQNRSLRTILGTPDDRKFHSSMTLFSIAAGGAETVFRRALARWFDAISDAHTLELLQLADTSDR